MNLRVPLNATSAFHRERCCEALGSGTGNRGLEPGYAPDRSSLALSCRLKPLPWPTTRQIPHFALQSAHRRDTVSLQVVFLSILLLCSSRAVLLVWSMSSWC